MSIESWRNSFEPPPDLSGLSRLLGEVLGSVFQQHGAFKPPPTVRFKLDNPFGASLEAVLSDVREKVIPYAVNSRHAWAMAHMVPPPALISIAADLVIGAMNQCAFIWEEAPLAAVLEQEVIRWIADRTGFGPGAAGLLTSGGTMSNCLATFLALSRGGGAASARAKHSCIVASDQAHLSLDKAATFVGLGDEAVLRVPTNGHGRLSVEMMAVSARRAADLGRHPFLFVCTAGTTNTGAFEPADEILSLAKEFGAWCHVDAAYGGFMSLSQCSGKLTGSWGKADSLSWDPHKTLYVSYSAGALVLKDGDSLRPLRFRGEYALKEDRDVDAGAVHLDGSRRLEALKVWMCIQHFGTEGYRRLTDYTLGLAKLFARQIKLDPAFVLLTEPDANIVCFTLQSQTRQESHDRLVESVQKALFRSGGPLLSTTKVGGSTVFRAVILNPLLRPDIFRDVLEGIKAEAERQRLLLFAPELGAGGR